MEPDLEPDIRQLAYHLWQTAGREFGQTALDFWAMAERMVVEMIADSVHWQRNIGSWNRWPPAESPRPPRTLVRIQERRPPARTTDRQPTPRIPLWI